MSFSSDVKSELMLRAFVNSDCCKTAQNYGLLLFGRSFSRSCLSILTENEEVASAYADAVEYFSGSLPETEVSDVGNYKITVEDKAVVDAALDKLGYNTVGARRRINFANLTNPCCFASFIRGAFLASGTVTDPEKEYHLEFSSSSKALCSDLMKVFDEFDIEPKISERAGNYIVYIKKSSEIEDILSVMGATESSMMLMGAKMMKDVRNNVNRKVNFENANMARSVQAAAKQYDAVALIKEKCGFDSLPADLKEIAALRYKNREASSNEIRAMLSEPLTVSGISHRFRRLQSIAEDLKARSGKKDGK